MSHQVAKLYKNKYRNLEVVKDNSKDCRWQIASWRQDNIDGGSKYYEQEMSVAVSLAAELWTMCPCSKECAHLKGKV